jgi:hypothetical protein
VEKWTTNEDSSGTFSEKIAGRAEAENTSEETTRKKKAERKAERKHFIKKIIIASQKYVGIIPSHTL